MSWCCINIIVHTVKVRAGIAFMSVLSSRKVKGFRVQEELEWVWHQLFSIRSKYRLELLEDLENSVVHVWSECQ